MSGQSGQIGNRTFAEPGNWNASIRSTGRSLPRRGPGQFVLRVEEGGRGGASSLLIYVNAGGAAENKTYQAID
jgi:hypothetical protein